MASGKKSSNFDDDLNTLNKKRGRRRNDEIEYRVLNDEEHEERVRKANEALE